MGLSAYDLIAFDNKGRPCNGVFKNHLGNIAEIRKTHLNIGSDRMWKPSCGYCKPYIAAINQGDLDLAGFNIKVVCEPQHSIFVLLSSWSKKGTSYWSGVGCYGYKDVVSEILKKHKRAKEISDDWCDGSSGGGGKKPVHMITNVATGEEIVYWDENTQGPRDNSGDWIGMPPSTVSKFFKWLDSQEEYKGTDYKAWLELCKSALHLKFNQGQAYFAKALKKPIPVVEVSKKKSKIKSK